MQITFNSDDDLELVQTILDILKASKIPTKLEVDEDIYTPSPIVALAPKAKPKAKVTHVEVIEEIMDTPKVMNLPEGMPPPPPPPMASKPQISESSFTEMMMKVADLLVAEKISNEHIEAWTRSLGCTVNGVGMIAALKDCPEMIPLFIDMVNNYVIETAT